jgi:hypothetical protein
MRIIGMDLHARQKSVAMLDTETGELVEKTLEHEGEKVREFYCAGCWCPAATRYRSTTCNPLPICMSLPSPGSGGRTSRRL